MPNERSVKDGALVLPRVTFGAAAFPSHEELAPPAVPPVGEQALDAVGGVVLILAKHPGRW